MFFIKEHIHDILYNWLLFDVKLFPKNAEIRIRVPFIYYEQ